MFWPAPWWDRTVLHFTKAVAEHCLGRPEQYQNREKYLQYTSTFFEIQTPLYPPFLFGRRGGEGLGFETIH